MKTMTKRLKPFFAACLAGLLSTPALTQEELPVLEEPLSIAVLDFEVSDRRTPTLGKDVADLLTVEMMMQPSLILVERSRLQETLSEQELGLSGMVDSATAAKVGHLTGANVLVSGRIFDVSDTRHVVARVVSTETGRVFADKVSYDTGDDLNDYISELSERIAVKIVKNAETMRVAVASQEDVVETLKATLEGKELPSVAIRIPEEHIGRRVPDPAAETEIALVLKKLGFQVYESNADKADIHISGEAFSELGMTRGNLVSCRGRLEVKAANRKDEVIFVDRRTTIAVDLAENFAGKKALQKAGLEMVKILVPALADAAQ